MNIDDVYFTQVYSVDRIQNKGHFVTDYHAILTRTTLVLRKEQYGNVKYYDLIENRYLNNDMYGTEIGDEVVGIEKLYIKFTDVYPYNKKHITKRKMLNLLKEGSNAKKA